MFASGSERSLQRIDHVGPLPGQVKIHPPEMTIGCNLFVDGAAQIQFLDDLGGAKVKEPAYQLRELLIADHPGTVGVYQ